MKLPGIDYGGRAESLSPESHLRSARAWSNALEALGDTARDFVDKRETDMVNTDMTEDRNELAKLESQLRQPYQEVNTLSSNIDFEPMEEKMVNGQLTQVNRTKVPTFEVQSQIMDQFLQKKDESRKQKYSSNAYRKWKDKWNNYGLAARTRNGIAQMDSARAADNARVLGAANDAAEDGRYEDAIAGIQNSNLTIPEQIKAIDAVEQKKEKDAQEAELAVFHQAVIDGDIGSMQKILAEWQDEENYTGSLTSQQRVTGARSIMVEIRRAEAKREQALNEAQSKNAYGLMRAIDNNVPGAIIAAEQDFLDGKISDAQWQAIYRRHDVVQNRLAREAELDARVADIGTGPIDQDDREQREAVDRAYEGIESDLTLSQPEKNQQIIDLIERHHYIPDRLQSEIVRRSQQPEEAAQAAMFVAQVREHDPKALKGLSEGTQNRLELIEMYKKGGFSDKDAFDLAIKKESMNQNEFKEREGILKQQWGPRYQENWIEEFYDEAEGDPKYAGVPRTALQRMLPFYLKARRDKAVLSFDIGTDEPAAKNAFAATKGMYDGTAMNSRALESMKLDNWFGVTRSIIVNAPEEVYGNRADIPQDDVTRLLLKQLHERATELGIRPEYIFIQSDETTERGSYGNFSYPLGEVNEFGGLTPVIRGGVQQRWTPDPRRLRAEKVQEVEQERDIAPGDSFTRGVQQQVEQHEGILREIRQTAP